MSEVAFGPWLALVGLGAFHGINPAMGWLLAVARGLQTGRRSEVWRALPAIALGHEAAVAATAVLVSGVQLFAAPDLLRVGSALVLLAYGAFKLLRPGRAHVRWVGVRLGWLDIVLWSFLMSSAHGAGFMLIPFFLGLPANQHVHDDLASLGLDLTSPTVASLGLAGGAVVLHTGAMLLVMGALAIVVYEKVGVRILRRAWINLDLAWAVALLSAGVVTMFS
jgi:hypothetical protein